MSIEQLAIDTKIPRASIEALEEDRFGALPGPVFVKGFFRCCARSLELDPETVLALLHEQERALQQLKTGRRERPHLLDRQASKPEPARAGRGSVSASTSASTSSSASTTSSAAASSSVAMPAAAASGNAAVAAPAPLVAATPLFNFEAVLPWLRRTILSAANSRLVMWIAIGLMIAVIVMTAFMMVGGPSPTPRS